MKLRYKATKQRCFLVFGLTDIKVVNKWWYVTNWNNAPTRTSLFLKWSNMSVLWLRHLTYWL